MKRLHLNRLLLFTFAVVGMMKQTAFALITSATPATVPTAKL